MARKKKRAAADEPNAELLPPREALSLWPTTDPAAYTGLLGTTDPAAASGAAASTAGSADDIADAQASGSEEQTVSDQPQTITRDDTQTASSET